MTWYPPAVVVFDRENIVTGTDNGRKVTSRFTKMILRIARKSLLGVFKEDKVQWAGKFKPENVFEFNQTLCMGDFAVGVNENGFICIPDERASVSTSSIDVLLFFLQHGPSLDHQLS
eukprot:jgi/Bigna1/143298/aug1.77_g18006